MNKDGLIDENEFIWAIQDNSVESDTEERMRILTKRWTTFLKEFNTANNGKLSLSEFEMAVQSFFKHSEQKRLKL